MRKLIIILTFLSLLLMFSCIDSAVSMTDPEDGSTFSTGYDNPKDEAQCHDNMKLLGTGISMFYGMNNRYPDNLSELVVVDPKLCNLTCPSCNLPYLYDLSSTGEVYTVTCPLPVRPNHGFVENGHCSWPPDPQDWPGICHSNMRTLATCCSMFYGINNRYPEELSEFGTSGIYKYWDDPCPACGELYIYETNPVGDTYSIYCPMPVDPNHGYVIDGVCYWPPDTSGNQEACRNNMRCLATGCSIFYGSYNRYPNELSELGTSGIMENWDQRCPACGELYHYSADSVTSTYLIRCPLPWDPNHGSIEDGMTSWTE
ncbi:MAG: hypothetical protein K8S15_12860 [Candidatus Aegiribacteria sp.]|nr:hypothetical protein [Candidatus Aegiribacteria sp.]